MWRRAVTLTKTKASQSWRIIPTRGAATDSGKPGSTSASAAAAVDSLLLRSLKDHYLEVSKMTPPPKVSPPPSFTIVKGALDSNGPVLKRMYGKEEISVYAVRLANIIPGGGDDLEEEDGINQLFVHIDVSKAGQEDSLHFLCGLYPDAIGIHSVSMRPKLETLKDVVASKYSGPVFEDLDQRMRDALHGFIEERGINENLFPFLQAWLYVKDHRNLIRWFKSVGTVISEKKIRSDH